MEEEAKGWECVCVCERERERQREWGRGGEPDRDGRNSN